MGTVKDGLSKNIIPTTGYLEGESDLVSVSVMYGMSGCVHPGPDQNTFSCTYSDNSFRLSTGTSYSLKGGKFGHIQLPFTDYKVVNNDISGFSTHIMQAVKYFSAQEAYCRSAGIIPLNVRQFIQYSRSQLLNSTEMKLWVSKATTAVKNTDTSNYKQARLVVPLGLNVKNWRRYLEHYDIKVLCDYLEFGFPLKVDRKIFHFNTEIKNHSSARLSSEGVDKYFNDEIKSGAIVGPFQVQPFERIYISPLMARQISDGSTRVIVDLSWPSE